MTSIERTAYPRFRRAPTVRELREIYTPTPTDLAFVATTARGPAQKFGLMLLLKVYQRLGYFPKPETIPGALIGHIRATMKFGNYSGRLDKLTETVQKVEFQPQMASLSHLLQYFT